MSRPDTKQVVDILNTAARRLQEWDDGSFVLAAQDDKGMWHAFSKITLEKRVALARALLDDALDEISEESLT